MSPDPIPFYRSIAGRLALSAMVLVIAATLLLYVVTASQVRQQEMRSLQKSVDTDVAGLADIYLSAGQDELVRRLHERIQYAHSDEGDFYRLELGERLLAGNVSQWPTLDARRSMFGTFVDPSGVQMAGRATQLNPDLRLFVGRHTGQVQETLAALKRAFVFAGSGVSILTLILGYLISLRLSRRLDDIDELHNRAARGEMTGLPVMNPRGDELSLLAFRTQVMLQRQSDLVARYRESSEHAAHEIRSPLMHLDTRLHKLLGQSADPRVQETLANGREDIRSVVRLLESLLDISSAQAHLGDTSDFEPLDLSQLVSRIAEIYADSAEDQGYTFSTHITPDIQIQGNAVQLERILSNLLDNAFKFSPQGCTIQVTLKAGPVLTVADTGMGVPAAMRENIFKRFQRSHGVTASGHGLGLPLAQAFAARHGLRIRLLESQGGAIFEMAPMEMAQ